MVLRNLLPAGFYYGERVLKRRFGAIEITETAYSGGEVLEPHSHSAANVFVVAFGRLTETVGRVRVEHGPDTVVYNPVGISHGTAFHGRVTRVLNLQCDEDWLAPIRDRLALRKPARSAPVHLSARLVREFRSSDDLSGLAVEGLVEELLAELGRVGPRVERSPPPWLRRAEGMLIDPRHSLAEIALACGFVDQSHLNRAFQALRGTTPGRMRRERGSREGNLRLGGE